MSIDPRAKHSNLNLFRGMRYLAAALVLACFALNVSCSSTRKAARLEQQQQAVDDFIYRYAVLTNEKRYDDVRDLIDSMITVYRWPKDDMMWFAGTRAGMAVAEDDYARAEREYLALYRRNKNALHVLTGLGIVYYNQGVAQLDLANHIDRREPYLAAKEQAKDYMRQALPYLERGHAFKDIGPKDEQYRMAIVTMLRSIYYTLEMGVEFDRLDREYKEMSR